MPPTASTSTIHKSPANSAQAQHPQTAHASTADSPSGAPVPGGIGLHKRGLSSDAQSPAESNASSQPRGDNAGPDGQRTKKRRTGPGSRGVANLTPEQLAKKRANDREAQRAIRERTKNQIETLELRIKELTSQQPYQELQAAIRAKEHVEAELADLKGRMASIMTLLQPVLTTQPAEGVYASPVPTFLPGQTAGPLPSIPSAHNASTPPDTASPISTDPPWHQAGMQSAGSSTQPSPSFSQVKMISQQRQNSLHALDFGLGEQLKLDFLLDPASSERVNRMQTGVNGAQDTPNFNHLPMKHDWNNVSLPSPQSSSLAHTLRQDPPQHQHRVPFGSESNLSHTPESWVGSTATIKNCPPTCPLDSLLLDFLQERRQRAAEGVSPQEIVGPRYPSVSSLLNPARSAFSHPLSKVFTDILATFPGICMLPERVAVLYIMFLVMRWQISPTKENYNLLPPWAQPVPAQLYNTHPAWIDHLPFPRMRDKLTKEYNPSEFLFDNFFIPFTLTLSVNWPYEATDTLLQSSDGDELLINPVFERHMGKLENWTLGEQFHMTFPQLEGTYNLASDGKREWERGEGEVTEPRGRTQQIG
ncbi:BZIP transcription factor [Xylariales sp. AK1849]|nr:BZIP transcription factor [Xylariales sp. AK1849]